MNRFFLLLVILYFVAIKSYAIDDGLSKTVAINYYYEQIQSFKKLNYDKIYVLSSWTEKRDDVKMFSVYNMSEGGFVIVAESELVIPILGFSFVGTCEQSLLNPAVKFWLDSYSAQIAYAIETKAEPNERIINEWRRLQDYSKLRSQVKSGVAPMLHTKWNQGIYYNAFCPNDASGPDGHVVTGCVATALGQLINYFRYPLHGIGSYGYNHDVYGWIEEDFSQSSYNYNNMPEKLTGYNDDVAKLLYDIGVSVDMNYGPNGSGMWNHKGAYTLKTYFDFNENTTYLFRDSMPAEFNWKETLVNHLNQGIPLYYAGWGDYEFISGHAFILDGYQDEDYYHINWGWGGNSDGYFFLDNLRPGGNNFTLLHEVIINAVPNFVFTEACQSENIINSYSGSIDDGSGPLFDYLPNSDCEWLIQPTDSANGIKFQFVKFNIANDDSVIVFDGPDSESPVLGVFTGNIIPVEFVSTADKVLVKFISNSENQAGGFLLLFAGNKPTYCTPVSNITEPSGVITDGSGQYLYHNNTYCNWRIQPENAQQFKVRFTQLDIEPTYDYVRILNSANQNVATYSGTTIPDELTIDGSKITISFKTNARGRAGGFSLEYETTQFTNASITNFEEFDLYPNPCGGTLFFNIPSCNNQQHIELISADGRLVYNKVFDARNINNKYSLDVSNFASGLYLVRFFDGENVIFKKLLIEN